MADRQNIDALLIGALYGELTPTEETQLAAHLEAHPADRTALDGLTRARELVVESRLLEAQVEPPQAVSALLLQEAARRAPKVARSAGEQDGWFARFVRAFAANPAIAAAAMLVVVLGAAALLTSRKGDRYVQSEQATTDSTTAPRATITTATGAETGDHERESADRLEATSGFGEGKADSAGAAAPSETAAGYETDQYKVTLADEKLGGAKGASQPASTGRLQEELAKEQVANKPLRKPSPQKNEFSAVELRRTTPTPKDLDGARFDDDAVAPGGATPRPPPASRAPAQIATDGRDANDLGAAPKADPAPRQRAASSADKAPDPLLAWAQRQHAQVIAQVRAGNCPGAAGLAVEISNRAPAYYSQNVATDRAIKNCVSYINGERERDADRRAAKARANRAEPEAPRPAKPAANADSK